MATDSLVAPSDVPFTYVGDHDPSESVRPAHFHLITSIDLITDEKHRIMRISWNGLARFKFVRRVIANCGRLRKGYCPNVTPSKAQLCQTIGRKCTTPFDGDLRAF